MRLNKRKDDSVVIMKSKVFKIISLLFILALIYFVIEFRLYKAPIYNKDYLWPLISLGFSTTNYGIACLLENKEKDSGEFKDD